MRSSATQISSLFLRLLLSLLTLTLAPSLAGCRAKKPPVKAEEPPVQFTHELPANELALRKIPPAEYPDFTPTGQTDPQGVIAAIDRSLAYLKAPSSRGHYPYLDITHERAVATLVALRDVYQREVLQDPTAGQPGRD